MVLGPPGSGKTEICAYSNLSLPKSRIVGDITPPAFLPCFNTTTGQAQNNLLPPDGDTCIWVAKDFTTLASKRPDTKREIASTLREVWDGEIVRDTGVGKTRTWSGKVSFIACATPEIEEAWGSMRALGERFLSLRWRGPARQDWDLIASRVRAQLGQGGNIRSEMQARICELCDCLAFVDADPPSDAQMAPIDSLAMLVATLRTVLRRDLYAPGKPIVSRVEPEYPTRIISALSQVCRTHRAMFPGARLADTLRLARRLAADTIPAERALVLRELLRGPIPLPGLQLETKIPEHSLLRTIEDLVALEALDRSSLEGDKASRTIVLAHEFEDKLRSSGMAL
jgi:hypothetical protein